MSQPLLSLAPSELRALAGAIRMGRLGPPFPPVAIKQIMNDHAAALSETLQELAATGMPPAGIAQCLELLAQALAERPRLEDLVQFVATGPQVSGVANRDTSVVVADLFSRAEQSVLVIGYAVYQGQKVFQALASRMHNRPALDVRMYLDIPRKSGDTSMELEIVKRFCRQFQKTQWPSGTRLPQIYYDPRSTAANRDGAASLHAKCVVVDGEHVFVSSANFTEAGQKKNIELGLLLTSRNLAQKILQFMDSCLDASYLKRAM